jgi:hypothetical protein
MVKTWKVSATIKNTTQDFYVKAETLYEAFLNYYKIFGTKHLTEIWITEVKLDE